MESWLPQVERHRSKFPFLKKGVWQTTQEYGNMLNSKHYLNITFYYFCVVVYLLFLIPQFITDWPIRAEEATRAFVFLKSFGYVSSHELKVSGKLDFFQLISEHRIRLFQVVSKCESIKQRFYSWILILTL